MTGQPAPEELFTAEDLQVVESQMRYDATLRPKFEVSAGALTWKDEWPPDDLSPTGFDTISKLWVARSILHHGRQLGGPQEYIQYLTDVWNGARALNLKWPGFEASRLVLSDADKAFLQEQKQKQAVQTADGL